MVKSDWEAQVSPSTESKEFSTEAGEAAEGEGRTLGWHAETTEALGEHVTAWDEDSENGENDGGGGGGAGVHDVS